MREETLINGLHLAAAGSTTAFLDKYPVLKQILNKSKRPGSDWDFFMTVGGVGLYYLKHKVSHGQHFNFMKALSNRDKQMPEGLNNFFSYFESHKDPTLDPRVMVGFWVLWNIAGEPPTQEQNKDLGPAIGIYLDRVVTDLAS